VEEERREGKREKVREEQKAGMWVGWKKVEEGRKERGEKEKGGQEVG